MNFKELVFKSGYKQIYLAKHTGINYATLSKFLNEWVILPKKHHKTLASILNISEKIIEQKNKEILTSSKGLKS